MERVPEAGAKALPRRSATGVGLPSVFRPIFSVSVHGSFGGCSRPETLTFERDSRPATDQVPCHLLPFGLTSAFSNQPSAFLLPPSTNRSPSRSAIVRTARNPAAFMSASTSMAAIGGAPEKRPLHPVRRPG